MFSFLFKDAKPFSTGYLPDDKGHSVYFHQFGNPEGVPVFSFHGGPGSRSKPKHAKLYNLKKFRVILFDQRGCGMSTPAGKFEDNGLADLLHDAKRLLDMLGIEKAIISGASWGAALALVFAQNFPERVQKLIVSSVFLARQKDIDWIAKESSRFYPDLMQEMVKELNDQSFLRSNYAQMILSDNKADQIKAARLYGSYERMIGQLNPSFSAEVPTDDHIAAFKIYMHYDRYNYGLQENQILENIETIKDIPTLIVHNRLDMICPLKQAWLLHRSLNNAKLVIVPDAGHSSELLVKTIKKEVTAFLEQPKVT